MRRTALLLALLALGPAAGQAPTTGDQGPTLTIVPQPEYTPGDFWQYRVTLVGTNGTSLPQEQTIRVVDLPTFEGQPAVRLFTSSMQELLGDDQSGSFYATSNKTTWMTQQGLKVLRIEEDSNRTQYTSAFRVLTYRQVNWTFHEPMDLYQFPIVKDDAWVVVTNATLNTTTSIFTHVQNSDQRSVPPRLENGSLYQTSGTNWVRSDACGPQNNCTGAGNFTGVVLFSRSGNATIRDFWSPQVGNLVRREIFNETGTLVETSVLQAYKFAKAPAPPSGRPGPGVLSGSWMPVAGAAVLGVAVALGALFALGKFRKGPPPADAPPTEPASPPPGAPPEEPPAETASTSAPADHDVDR